MSLIKTIKAQLGLSNTAAQNFTLTAEASDGTMKLARGNPGATTQDILTVDANGKVSFPLGTSTGKLFPFTKTGLAVSTKYTITHNLNTKDIWFFGYLECTTSEFGFAVGDRVPVHLSTGAPDNYGLSVYIDSVNTATIMLRPSGFGVYQKAALVSSEITMGNWKVVMFIRPMEG